MAYSACNRGKEDPASLFKAELLLLRQRWHIILLGLAFQYVHGIFTQLAYRMHQPAARPLHDVGFEAIPELPGSARWVSEAIFTFLLLSFIGWSFTPLLSRQHFSTVVLWTRLLTVLVVCQSLRILSFSSTQLPGPAPHCRAGTATATRPRAPVWWGHLVVDVRTQVARSCGDLIFSSHMTFILTGVLAYTHYGTKALMKAGAWAAAAVLAVLIIAARKHYTVDVIIAWYTVPMVYMLLHVYWSQQNGCSSGSSACCLVCSSCSGNSSTGGMHDVPVATLGANDEAQLLHLPSSYSAVSAGAHCCCGSLARNATAAAAGEGRAVQLPRMVWWFGREVCLKQQQQQQFLRAGNQPADVEAQTLLPRRVLDFELSAHLEKL